MRYIGKCNSQGILNDNRKITEEIIMPKNMNIVSLTFPEK